MFGKILTLLKEKFFNTRMGLIFLGAFFLMGAMGYGGYKIFYTSVKPPLNLDRAKMLHTISHDQESSQRTSSTPTATSAPLPALEKTSSDLPQSKKDYHPCLKTPKELVLIVTGLGLDAHITDRAIRELPESVVLSFSSYAKMINQWIQPARAVGHELLIEINNEKDLDNLGILSYFDGILLLPGKVPIRDPKVLRDFVGALVDKQKILIEGRLLAHNHLLKEAHRQEFSPHILSHMLTTDTLFMDQQDILSQRGCVAITASLVPYLIVYLNGKKPSDIHLSTLSKVSAP